LVWFSYDGWANVKETNGGSDQAKGGYHEREEYPARILGCFKDKDAKNHCANVFGCGGLEEVGTTASAVTDVVTPRSAITAGLRGSSSGMFASTLPTRSAPTSAALVKIPPPRRANTEISDPPNARPTSASGLS